MNHPTEDELLLLVYGELPPSRGAEIESHTAACRSCRETLARLEHGRVALEFALPARRRNSSIRSIRTRRGHARGAPRSWRWSDPVADAR